MKTNLILGLMATILLFSCKDKPIDSPEIYDEKGIDLLQSDTIALQLEDTVYNIKTLRNDTLAVIEGDMIVRLQPRTTPETIKIKSWGINGKKWTNNTVYYTINSNAPNPNDIEKAIAHWEAKVPGIKFKLKDAQTTNYVEFIKGKGPSSQIGMVDGRQQITTSETTIIGSIVHEIGHTLGLWHEQSRDDRDKYITIDFGNIIEAAKDNYIIQNGERNGTDYDYGSIMHYPAYSKKFAKDPTKPVIKPKQSNVVIGQRTALSASDISAVKKRYGL